MKLKLLIIVGLFVAISGGLATTASSANWGPATSIGATNTLALEGCPFEAPDGLSLFFASDRPGGVGGLDIWIAQRTSFNAPWGPAVNAGAPVNSSSDDFCPTPTDTGHLYFVSTRPGGCGGADIYKVRLGSGPGSSFETLGCQLNSPAAEFSPSLIRDGGDTLLYFSSNRPGGFAPEDGAPADHDIYVSKLQPNGAFAPATLVPGVNSAAEDSRPNVRLDGTELVFDSTRPGGLGGPDIWISTRTGSTWSPPVNAGATINTASGESRPSFSRTGDRLYFGSNKPGGQGSSDIYVSARDGSSAAVPVTTAAPIRPPSTGDAGLSDGRSAPAYAPAIALVTTMLLLAAAATRRISR